jgi:hypothetical protein
MIMLEATVCLSSTMDYYSTDKHNQVFLNVIQQLISDSEIVIKDQANTTQTFNEDMFLSVYNRNNYSLVFVPST